MIIIRDGLTNLIKTLADLTKYHPVEITIFISFQEREVIAGIKRQLQQKIDESFEHLCVLQEARQQILADLQVGI